jgi:hypothetical protein
VSARPALALVLGAACACGSARPVTRDAEVIVVPTAGSAQRPVVTVTSAPPRTQTRDPKIISAIGPVEIGQTVAELRSRLGQELKHTSVDDEAAAFTSFHYDTKRVVAFILGFDEVLTFNDDAVRSDPPIWKIYVRDDRAVLMKITTVGFEEHLREHRIGYPPSCFLLDPPPGIFETFGQVFIEEKLSDHVTYHYVDRGISVMTFNDAIRVFDVYGDVGDGMRQRIKAALDQ